MPNRTVTGWRVPSRIVQAQEEGAGHTRNKMPPGSLGDGEPQALPSTSKIYLSSENSHVQETTFQQQRFDPHLRVGQQADMVLEAETVTCRMCDPGLRREIAAIGRQGDEARRQGEVKPGDASSEAAKKPGKVGRNIPQKVGPDTTPNSINHSAELDLNLLGSIMTFVGDKAFLGVASVSVRWRDAWGRRPTVTSARWAVQSRSCLDWAKECGLDIWHGPCLYAAAEGRLDVLQHAIALGYSREGMLICEHAAEGGHLAVLRWCRANGYPWGRSSLRAAASGHLEIFLWCMINGCPWGVGVSNAPSRDPLPGLTMMHHEDMVPTSPAPQEVMTAAASGGHLEIVRWCKEQGCPWPQNLSYFAARGGHLGLLKWLRASGCPWSEDTMLGAVEANHLEMLEWCGANDCPWNLKVFQRAARLGNLQILSWCIANGPMNNWRSLLCGVAAAQGHLEVVRWLRANGFPWGPDVCYLAASGGHFKVLEWCVANGCSWDRTSLPLARGFAGDAKMMTWAESHGCPWMSNESELTAVCTSAAVGGNFGVLEWCRSRGHAVSWGRLPAVAASRGHVHVLEWMRANGLMLYECYGSLCQEAAKAGSLEVLKWCREQGHYWDERTCSAAAQGGNLKLLQWCRANGCPWDTWTCWFAAGRGDIEMLAWCRANGCPWDRLTWIEAVEFGHVEVLEWCRVHGCPGEDRGSLAKAPPKRVTRSLRRIDHCARRSLPPA